MFDKFLIWLMEMSLRLVLWISDTLSEDAVLHEKFLRVLPFPLWSAYCSFHSVGDERVAREIPVVENDPL